MTRLTGADRRRLWDLVVGMSGLADPAPWRARLLAAARYLDPPPRDSRPGSLP